MLEIPVVRWGQQYESLEKSDVVHFENGEVMAQMHQANAGLVRMDIRKAAQARNQAFAVLKNEASMAQVARPKRPRLPPKPSISRRLDL